MLLNLKFFVIKTFGSQAAFARKIGMKENLLSRIIMERQEATSEQRRVICDELGIRDEKVFFGD